MYNIINNNNINTNLINNNSLFSSVISGEYSLMPSTALPLHSHLRNINTISNINLINKINKLIIIS